MGSCLTYESRSPLPASPTDSMGIRKRKSLKKRRSRNSSFEHRREELLHKVTGRLFLNGASEAASLFSQQGKKGINQDAMIVWENFGSRTDTIFCGVFDGHGPYGHLVSKRVRDSLPLKLSAHWENNITDKDVLREISLNRPGSLNSENLSVLSVEEEMRSTANAEEAEKQPEIFQKLRESFVKAFKIMDRELKISNSIDCMCSGSTAVTLVKQGSNLVIGNIGDSRAILATRHEDNSLIAVQLTVDLKPSLPAEAERIRKCKGRIFSLQDEPDVARVWLPNYDTPGLAMARAFGDFCLKDFGLISVPEISCRHLSEKDEFIVLATDGVWDVLSNKEVVDIVASSARPQAARRLVETAVRAWRYKYPTSRIDDCAVVCLFLDSTPNSSTAVSTAKFKESSETSTEKEDLTSKNRFNYSVDAIPSDKSIIGEENHGETAEENKDEASEWADYSELSRVDTLLNLPRFVSTKDTEILGVHSKKRK